MSNKDLHYSTDFLLNIYKHLITPRLIEEKMLILLRQGKVSKWFSGMGQEAISVGTTLALDSDEYLFPMHRNLGVFTSRNVPLHRLFAQFQGKENGFTKGRDRSFHFGSKEHHIVGMISHLGAQLSVADGVALKRKLCKEQKVTVVFTGEGGTSEGEFHEALNVASVWDLPIIFIVEQNGYAISTPTHEQYKFDSFIHKGKAYGMEAISIDGNNVLEVYETIKQKAEEIRQNPRPVLIEMNTFRIRGHEESSGIDYVPKELFEEWEKKDPVQHLEKILLEKVDNTVLEEIQSSIKQHIQEEWNIAFESSFPTANTNNELNDVFKPHQAQQIEALKEGTEMRLIDSIRETLKQNMKTFPQLILMGQDIAEYGGVFKATEDLSNEFGKERVRNTPICESAIIGIGLGLSIEGFKSVIEMQFADFVSCGFNQIVNNLAKSHYRWGQNADVVIRMPSGAGTGAGPFHSQSTEAWFFHTAGLKIVYPSSPQTAKGLLNSAIQDPNPVLFFEHKKLYRSTNEFVPDNEYTIEIGKANLIQKGTNLSIITYGMGAHWAKEVAKEQNIDADIIDLQSLMPWDKEAVSQTVKNTGKILLLTEDTETGSIMGEISAWISEHLFEYLDAPIMRVSSLDTPVPFQQNLEKNFLGQERLREKLIQLSAY
ncbi:MAG: dehydrogenase [Cytophagales bacterium]|nr:dehydrogenase [Cytophagales bacterium]